VNQILSARAERLTRSLAGSQKVVVAYSGGVDSAYLAAVAHDVLGRDAVAVTAVSPSLARRELDAAIALAEGRKWNHIVVQTGELQREEYVRNSPDRCYWCKTELLDVLGPIATERGAEIALGTNADDLTDYRPGSKAARSRGALTPLADAGLTKADVRELSREIGLPTSDKAASPCLASRFAYGVRVTEEGLRRIEAAEEKLRVLGLEVLRVRDHGDDLARVEVPAEDIEAVVRHRAAITEGLKDLGFRFVTLDLQGFRSGSLNEVLPGPRLRR
jgi:pyridinium-3,5-biscarboxylic acid mononucleotide sulfurtransferase